MPDFKRFVVRIPNELHADLVEWANQEGRSLHAHILYLIKQALTNHRRREARRKDTADE